MGGEWIGLSVGGEWIGLSVGGEWIGLSGRGVDREGRVNSVGGKSE